MQSERGLWGQGVGFGKQPHCETCRFDPTQPDRPHMQGLTFFFKYVNKHKTFDNKKHIAHINSACEQFIVKI